MSKVATSLVRHADGYPFEEIEEGLRASGYAVQRAGSRPDLLVTWTPWRGSPADRLGSLNRDRWLAMENGYVRELGGKKYFSIGLGGYNGTERVIPELDRELKIAFRPTRIKDGPILVIGQFGHTDDRYSMPVMWPEDVVRRIRMHTDRAVIFRPKLSYRRVRMPVFDSRDDVVVDGTTPLSSQLDMAHSVVTWNSPSISVEAVMKGVPMFVDGRNCVAKCCSAGQLSDIERPKKIDTASLLRRLTGTLWSVDDIRSGKAFTTLTEYLQ